MASKAESSFGAKLRRAQDLQANIQNFVGYAPPRTQESITGFQALITSLVATNNTEAIAHQQYKTAVDLRQQAFKTNPVSINKLLPQLKGAIDAQFGKKSTEATIAAGIIKTMRAAKLVTTPVATTMNPENTKTATVISHSQRSYGSQIQFFNNLVSKISQFTAYNPSNNALKLAQLQAFSTSVTTLNNTVAQKVNSLKTARKSRETLYADLKDRTQRIKQYVKAQYGINSNEYRLIKGL